jgi:hypothetical protein
MIRRLLIILGMAALWLVLAAPAQAISADDCENTLRGQVGHVGWHGYDNDIYARWQKIEIERGVNITSSWRTRAWHPGGYGNQVGAEFVFLRANGATIWHVFHCYDGRDYGTGYQDNWWYHVSG